MNSLRLLSKPPYLSSSVDTKFYILGHTEDEDNPYIGATGSVAAQRVWANDDSTIANGNTVKLTIYQ